MLTRRVSLYIQRHKAVERERLEMIFHTKNNQKKAGLAILISDKIDLIQKVYKSQRSILYVNKISTH